MSKLKALLVSLALLVGVAVPVALLAAPAYAWSCSDGYCHAITHRAPDDGYDQYLLVRCGANMVQFGIGEGQNSQAVGCNDVNQWFVRAGHSINCDYGAGVVEFIENTGSSGFWATNNLGSWGAGLTYGCYDAAYYTIGGTGGGGGGGGGGGTW